MATVAAYHTLLGGPLATIFPGLPQLAAAVVQFGMIRRLSPGHHFLNSNWQTLEHLCLVIMLCILRLNFLFAFALVIIISFTFLVQVSDRSGEASLDLVALCLIKEKILMLPTV